MLVDYPGALESPKPALTHKVIMKCFIVRFLALSTWMLLVPCS